MDQECFFLAYCLCSLHANLLVQSQVHANLMAYWTGYLQNYLI